MGLQKAKTVGSGVTGNYWKITNLSIDRIKHEMIANIGLFVNKAGSDAGNKPLLSHSFKLNFDENDLEGEKDLVAIAYNAIKALCADEPGELDINKNKKKDLHGAVDA